MPPTTTLPRKAHAVILDMDGLMFDTEALYRDAVIAAAADGGHDISTAFYLSTIGMSIEATRTAFRERCGKDFDFTCSGRQRRNFARSPNCSYA